MEPISGALRNAFQGVRNTHCNGERASLESGLQAVTKKTHLAPVAFDPPVRAKQQQELPSFSSTPSSGPSQYILLNPGYDPKTNGNGNGHSANTSNCNGGTKNGGEAEKTSDPTSPPRPKVGELVHMLPGNPSRNFIFDNSLATPKAFAAYTHFDEHGTAQSFDIVPFSTHRQTY